MGKVMFMRKGEVHTIPGSRLPYGYTELVYIQSSGTQYIDTGLKPTSTMRVEIEFIPLNHTSAIFGSQWDGSGFFLADWSDGMRWHSYGTAVIAGQSLTASKNKAVCTPAKCIMNNVQYEIPQAGTNATTYNIYLFWVGSKENSAYTGVFKLYSCKIYDNSTLVRDFVPCVTSDGNIGLYELVDKKFYGNIGTGTFIGSEVA